MTSSYYFDDFKGVEKEIDGQFSNYDETLNQELGFYSNGSINHIARQVGIFTYLPYPANYSDFTIEIDTYTFPDPAPKSGTIKLTLVNPSFANYIGQQQHYDYITSGQELGETNYNANNTALDPSPVEIENSSKLNDLENYAINNSGKLNIGLHAGSEAPNSLYTELNTLELTLVYQEPTIEEAKFRKKSFYFCFGGYPNLGSSSEELTVTLTNAPENTPIDYIVHDGKKSAGEISTSYLGNNKLLLEGEINNGSEDINISDRVVFSSNKFSSIYSWEELPEESNYDDLICTPDPDPDPLPFPNICEDENGNLYICEE